MLQRTFFPVVNYIQRGFKLNGNTLKFGTAISESSFAKFLGAQFSSVFQPFSYLTDPLFKQGAYILNGSVKKKEGPNTISPQPKTLPWYAPANNKAIVSLGKRQNVLLAKWLMPRFIQLALPPQIPSFQQANSIDEVINTVNGKVSVYPKQKGNFNFIQFLGRKGFVVMGAFSYLNKIVASDLINTKTSGLTLLPGVDAFYKMTRFFEAGILKTANDYQYVPPVDSNYQRQGNTASLVFDGDIDFIQMPLSDCSLRLSTYSLIDYTKGDNTFFAKDLALSDDLSQNQFYYADPSQTYSVLDAYQHVGIIQEVDICISDTQINHQQTSQETVLMPKGKVAKEYNTALLFLKNTGATYQFNGLARQAMVKANFFADVVVPANLIARSGTSIKAVSAVYSDKYRMVTPHSYPLTAMAYTVQTSFKNQSFSSSIMQVNIGSKDNNVKAISTQNGRTIIDIKIANACLQVEVSMDKTRNYIMHNAVKIHKNSAEQLLVQVLSQAERSILAKRMMNFINSIQTDTDLIDKNLFQDNVSSALKLNSSEQQLVEQMIVSPEDDAPPINLIITPDSPSKATSFESENPYKVTAYKLPKSMMNNPRLTQKIKSSYQFQACIQNEELNAATEKTNTIDGGKTEYDEQFHNLLSKIIKNGSVADASDPQIELYTKKMTDRFSSCSKKEDFVSLIDSMKTTAQNLEEPNHLTCVKNIIKDLTPVLLSYWPLTLFAQSYLDKIERIYIELKKVPLDQRADLSPRQETAHLRQAIASQRHTSYRSDATQTEQGLVYFKEKAGEGLTVNEKIDENKAAKSFDKFKKAIRELKESKTDKEQAPQQIQKPNN